MGKKHYYPLKWGSNPTGAIRFHHYLKTNGHERVHENRNRDYRLVALPLDYKLKNETV